VRCWENTQYVSKCFGDIACLCSEPNYQNVRRHGINYSSALSKFIANNITSPFTSVYTLSATRFILALHFTIPSRDVSAPAIKSSSLLLLSLIVTFFAVGKQSMLPVGRYMVLDQLRGTQQKAQTYQHRVSLMQHRVPLMQHKAPLLLTTLALPLRHLFLTSLLTPHRLLLRPRQRSLHTAHFPIWGLPHILKLSSPVVYQVLVQRDFSSF
jgi:hypothetical protein